MVAINSHTAIKIAKIEVCDSPTNMTPQQIEPATAKFKVSRIVPGAGRA